MADPGPLADVGKYALAATGGGGLVFVLTQILGGLARGWVTGAPTQEKEMRDDLRIEVGRLRDDLAKARDEIDEVREDMKRLTAQYLHVLSGRERARATLNAFEVARGQAVTVWPADPPAPGGTP